ncbi:MAG: hypothetical protein IT561_02040 [Alphaproteobacteria bacterium]|nr:hypothetical protein [Alphaproteobacteria bacterium]
MARASEAGRRRAHALRLRTAGLDYAQIAEAPWPPVAESVEPTGGARLYSGPAAARRAVARALAEATDDAPTERRLQARRLDLALAGAWAKALAGDGPGIDRILAIETRRARLLALDLPDAPVEDAGGAVQAAAAELAQKLQRLADLMAARPAGPCGNGAHPPAVAATAVAEARA